MEKKIKRLQIISLTLFLLLACTIASIVLITQELCAKIKDTREEVQTLTYQLNKIERQVTPEEESDKELDVSMFEEIQPNNIEKLSKGKTIVVFLGRSSCKYCVNFAEVLSDVQKEYNVSIKYINMSNIIDYSEGVTDRVLCNDANNIMLNLKTNDIGKEVMSKYPLTTPLLLIIKDNKVINGQVGYSSKTNVINILREEGFKSR